MTLYGGADMSEKEISNKMQEIMNRMKSRREELDMSYQTLSDKVGISKSTLQRYEDDERVGIGSRRTHQFVC